MTSAPPGDAPERPRAQGGATTRRAGDPPPAAEPLSRAPVQAAPRSSWQRAFLLALLVLLAGAILGAAAFGAEQHYFVWQPTVDPIPDGGWRVTGSQGLRPTSPVLAGDRLAWGQGGYTCVLELDSGDAHVVGVAPRGSSIWPPAAGARYVAWIETPRGAGEGHLWVYDTQRGRRQSFVVSREAATPAVAGDLVAWYDVAAGGTPRVETLDMATGRRAVLAEGAGIDYPVLAGDGVVGWVTRAGVGSAPSVVVRDLTAHTDTSIPLAGGGSGLSVGDIQLAGRVLLWTLTSDATARVVVYDVDARATSVVASGEVSAPATDGSVVVWASGEDSTGACVVRARSIEGADVSEIGRPAAWPSAMAVGQEWVAWTLDEGTWTYLEARSVGR